ncbi:hypothetical protein ACSSS7_006892 [Eimeria intestinalis]
MNCCGAGSVLCAGAGGSGFVVQIERVASQLQGGWGMLSGEDVEDRTGWKTRRGRRKVRRGRAGEARARGGRQLLLCPRALLYLKTEFPKARRPASEAAALRAVVANVVEGRVVRDDALAIVIWLQEDRAQAVAEPVAVQKKQPIVVRKPPDRFGICGGRHIQDRLDLGWARLDAAPREHIAQIADPIGAEAAFRWVLLRLGLVEGGKKLAEVGAVVGPGLFGLDTAVGGREQGHEAALHLFICGGFTRGPRGEGGSDQAQALKGRQLQRRVCAVAHFDESGRELCRDAEAKVFQSVASRQSTRGAGGGGPLGGAAHEGRADPRMRRLLLVTPRIQPCFGVQGLYAREGRVKSAETNDSSASLSMTVSHLVPSMTAHARVCVARSRGRARGVTRAWWHAAACFASGFAGVGVVAAAESRRANCWASVVIRRRTQRSRERHGRCLACGPTGAVEGRRSRARIARKRPRRKNAGLGDHSGEKFGIQELAHGLLLLHVADSGGPRGGRRRGEDLPTRLHTGRAARERLGRAAMLGAWLVARGVGGSWRGAEVVVDSERVDALRPLFAFARLGSAKLPKVRGLGVREAGDKGDRLIQVVLWLARRHLLDEDGNTVVVGRDRGIGLGGHAADVGLPARVKLLHGDGERPPAGRSTACTASPTAWRKERRSPCLGGTVSRRERRPRVLRLHRRRSVANGGALAGGDLCTGESGRTSVARLKTRPESAKERAGDRDRWRVARSAAGVRRDRRGRMRGGRPAASRVIEGAAGYLLRLSEAGGVVSAMPRAPAWRHYPGAWRCGER